MLRGLSGAVTSNAKQGSGRRIRRYGWLCAYLAAAPALLPAAQGAEPASRPDKALRRRVEARIDAFVAAHGGVVGVSATDLEAGRPLLAVREGRLFLPASNQKLLTSATALQRLGGRFRFVTGVFRAGPDVVVAGEGDPTLGDPHLAERAGRTIYHELDAWAAAVRRDANSIRDLVLCIDPRRGGRHPDWPAGQKRKWYVAPVSTLNFHNNCFDVTFTSFGGRLVPVLSPGGRFFRLIDRLRRGRSHLWSLTPSPDCGTVTLTGSIRGASDKPQSIAIDRPEMLLGRTLADRLARAGVAMTGRITAAAPSEIDWASARPLCRTATPLFTVMHRANKRSQNMVAEALFLRAGDGTWAGSAEIMTQTLGRTYGLGAGSFTVADGSGMSRRNGVAPGALTKLLTALAARRDSMLVLLSLPVGGVDGTLADRFTTGPGRRRVVAKTGYLAGASSLSGYLLDRSKRVRIVFSIMVNGFRGGPEPAKRLQERLCELLIEQMDRAAAGEEKLQPGQR